MIITDLMGFVLCDVVRENR